MAAGEEVSNQGGGGGAARVHSFNPFSARTVLYVRIWRLKASDAERIKIFMMAVDP